MQLLYGKFIYLSIFRRMNMGMQLMIGGWMDVIGKKKQLKRVVRSKMSNDLRKGRKMKKTENKMRKMFNQRNKC